MKTNKDASNLNQYLYQKNQTLYEDFLQTKFPGLLPTGDLAFNAKFKQTCYFLLFFTQSRKLAFQIKYENDILNIQYILHSVPRIVTFVSSGVCGISVRLQRPCHTKGHADIHASPSIF